MTTAHAKIGGFIACGSLLDYRIGQFVARWFCADEMQKFLSYTLKAIRFIEKRQVVEVRLSERHRDPDSLRETMASVAAVVERRDLVASGLLFRRSSGQLCIKRFSAARFISEEGTTQVIDIDNLPEWPEKATALSEQLLALLHDRQNAAQPA